MELQDLHYNETVILLTDQAFRGYVTGAMAPVDLAVGLLILVAVVEPGASGLHGLVRLPLAQLAKAPPARSR